ncbi:very short patch repair endonuclease [Geodermatophilus sp. URMC 63]
MALDESGRKHPRPRDAQVARQMQRMPRRDTRPEVALRRELHARGLRFRKEYRALPGKPDLAFTRARLVVFVDGCFWHRCPLHATQPKNNAEWWSAKLAANVARDRRQEVELQQAGWTVLRVWEHEPTLAAADRVEAVWRTLLASHHGSGDDV